ncbi:hypothetical protein U1E44_00425 [Arenibacter sp. GZD96]|uniref:hypothetical protein n=1 Tax=Aurantibrevibacter litoralis TaxID=3106030 RepID=UPI002AFE163E|nr:hypothetical protein [Arenibacter sp. GZD-96]MEA1784543.1 hypothetical protein [Arenibacter sp. GZD-96]
MHKIIKIVLVLLSAVGAVCWFMLPEAEMPAAQAAESGALNLMFLVAYLLLGIAVFFSLFYALKILFANPTGLKKALFTIGGLLLVVAISYGLASGTDVDLAEMANRGIPTTESTVKTIGMGLNVFFILTAIAVILMLLPGVKKIFTK